MLTGKRAFDAEDVSLTLAEVMKSEPDWKALLPPCRRSSRCFLRQCVKKDPRQRVTDIPDVRACAGRGIRRSESDVNCRARGRFEGPMADGRHWGRGSAGNCRSDGSECVVVATARHSSVIRLMASPTQIDFVPTLNLVDLAVSPDGRRIAYMSVENEAAQLYVRSTDSLEPLHIKGLNEPRNPFFSSDGAWIGFFEGETLKKVAVAGGPALLICQVTGIARGAKLAG
jgi:hypothetical protein